MTGRQLDLFDGGSGDGPGSTDRPGERPVVPVDVVDAAALDDATLIEGSADWGMAESMARAREIGRRRLAAGLPVLEALCRRHAATGRRRAVPEQLAAVEALAALGGSDAAGAIRRLIERGTIEGPGLQQAYEAAARLGAVLPDAVLARHLRHDLPAVRAAAARCVAFRPGLAPILVELLDSVDATVRLAAASALGRMGRREGRDRLIQALHAFPGAEVIAALGGIGDEEIAVLLGRLARRDPRWRLVVVEALEGIDHPTARRILADLGAAAP